MAGGRFGDRDDVRPSVHRLRDGRRPQEGKLGNHCSTGHRFHRRCQHLDRRGLRRCVHEPGRVVRTGCGQLELGEPLGVLGRTAHRRWTRRSDLRGHLHRLRDPRAAAHHRLLDGGDGK
ncbi:unnamed protein product [Linum tenue]|uniref:Uncharacterized protein n=2 Tax=Linum tenue TaxID=586396 RepID=A0AAV0PFN7_9ROSI|nr:unnamed protein product [Linum tenue]